MKKQVVRFFGFAMSLIVGLPGLVWAGGEKASTLVVVADTRRISSSIMRYFADLYNTDPWMFALWAAILTAVYGAFLGVIMDFLMSRTGLDLKSRKLVEH